MLDNVGFSNGNKMPEMSGESKENMGYAPVGEVRSSWVVRGGEDRQILTGRDVPGRRK